MIELLARVKAAIRRTTQYKNATLPDVPAIVRVHEIEMDLHSFIVKKKRSSDPSHLKRMEAIKALH